MQKVISSKKCLGCGLNHEIILPEGKSVIDFARDRSSGLEIQKSLSYLSPEQREILISGTCQKAWDDLFGVEEDEE